MKKLLPWPKRWHSFCSLFFLYLMMEWYLATKLRQESSQTWQEFLIPKAGENNISPLQINSVFWNNCPCISHLTSSWLMNGYPRLRQPKYTKFLCFDDLGRDVFSSKFCKSTRLPAKLSVLRTRSNLIWKIPSVWSTRFSDKEKHQLTKTVIVEDEIGKDRRKDSITQHQSARTLWPTQ